MLILTGLQLAFDYQRDLSKLQNNYIIIKNSYLDSMAEHLWAYDTRLLEIQLDGLSRLQGVSHLKLIADGKVFYEFGTSNLKQQDNKRFDVYHKNTHEVLGQLDVELDVSNLKQRYMHEAVWIFIRQAAKTLIVVFCLYFVFNHILVIHIHEIADYLRGRRGSGVLTLSRRHYDDKDELDVLVDSINLFRTELLAANEKLESLNHALEQKVQERTIELTNKNQILERAMYQIKRMQATLVAQERMASLGTLAASVAHEIRNPLNFVLNFSELLTDCENMEEVKEVSRVVLRHSQRIDQTVRSMQILSGYDTEALETTDINQILKRAYHDAIATCAVASCYVPSKVSYRMGESATAPVYPSSLLRALSNIINNSIHSLREKSHNDKKFVPELVLSTSIHGEFVEICVRDNGAGILPTLGQKIFDPFFTTKDTGEGSGLGLTVAFNIAQKHGGTLRYVSDLKNGTEFVMSIPLAHESLPL